MNRNPIARLLALLLILAILIGDGLVIHQIFVRWQGNRFDLYPRWVGVRAMLFEGQNPYSAEMARRVQMGYYGRPATAGESPHDFLYPAFVAFTIPHFLLPFPLAITAWIVTQQVFLFLIVIMMASALRRWLRPWQVALFAVALTTFRYNILSMGLGQFTIYVLFYLVLAWWLWEKAGRRRRPGRLSPGLADLLAGCALTQILLKPQLTFLILPLWLATAAVQKRWRFIAGFGLCLAVLVSLPLPFAGNWLVDFLSPPTRYQQAAGAIFLPEGSARLLRGLFSILFWPLVVWVWARAAGLRRQGWSIRRQPPPDFASVGYALALTTAVTLLTTPRIRGYDLALASLPLGFLILSRYRSGRAATIFQVAAWGTLLILPWILSLSFSLEELEAVERLIVAPVVLALILIFPLVRQGGDGIRAAGEADSVPGPACKPGGLALQ